jgi:hypothetical protein
MSIENQTRAESTSFIQLGKRVQRSLQQCYQTAPYAYDEKIIIYHCSLYGDVTTVQKAFCSIDGAVLGQSTRDWVTQPGEVEVPSIIIGQYDHGKNIWSAYVYAYSKSSFKDEADAFVYGKSLMNRFE